MSELFAHARTYFLSAASDPWRWDEEARVLVWADGSTIAFREEIAEILEGLSANGLPPFRVVVLILAACRGKVPPSSESKPILQRSYTHTTQLELPPPIPRPGQSEPMLFWNDPANQEFTDFVARLRLLHQLPPEQRESPRVKAVLIETLLEGLNVTRVMPGRDIARALIDLPALRELNSSDKRPHNESFRAYALLHAGLKNFSTLSFALRLRTGLDAVPEPAKIELRPAEAARQLLASLRTDPEQRGLAKVARDIMAAIYLPRSLSELDELALGGFSDIANRGSLDRLLSSELANDDLTLATRIALNEALYIRREPPSNQPPTQLAMLLDVGVRQWGLPRVFAAAVALAFIAKQEHCTNAAVWRARRTTLERADLLSRNGLVDHLGVLDSYAHPGASLKPFFAQFARQPDMEAVLVTHRDCVADPDFQRCVAEIDWQRFYIAIVDRDGSFELFAHPRRHKLLCQAQIDLDELFPEKTDPPSKPQVRLQDPKHDPGLPLILSVKPFPFLLPLLGKIQASQQLPDGGGVAALEDRRLVRWSVGKGAYTLIEHLPAGTVLWLGATDHGKIVHVVKQVTSGAVSLSSWNAITGESLTAELDFGREVPRQVYELNGILFAVFRRELSAWQLDSARLLGKLEIPSGLVHSQTRYFVDRAGNWMFLGHDATGLRFLPLPLPPKLKELRIVNLFDRDGCEDGPFALTANADVYSRDGSCLIHLGLIKGGDMVGFRRISRDGNRIVLKGFGDQEFQLIDLLRHSARRLPGATPLNLPARVLEPIVTPGGANLHVNFTHISSAPGEVLMLKSARGLWHKIALQSKALHLVPVPSLRDEPPLAMPFERVWLPTDVSFRLKRATWPDGSRAWLDSRGLLHLKRGNSTNPEVSLVLTDGPMAAWSSDGKICGRDFYLRQPALAEAATLMTRIEQFCPIA